MTHFYDQCTRVMHCCSMPFHSLLLLLLHVLYSNDCSTRMASYVCSTQNTLHLYGRFEFFLNHSISCLTSRKSFLEDLSLYAFILHLIGPSCLYSAHIGLKPGLT